MPLYRNWMLCALVLPVNVGREPTTSGCVAPRSKTAILSGKMV